MEHCFHSRQHFHKQNELAETDYDSNQQETPVNHILRDSKRSAMKKSPNINAN